MKKTLFCLLLFSCAGFAAQPAGQFDFYLLSLSWSPDFCQLKPWQPECRKQSGFVLHGLWPNYIKGYPEFCSGETLSAEVVKKYLSQFPSESLLRHEWKKHGTCSGLTAENYFRRTQQLLEKVIIPDDFLGKKPQRITINALREKFMASNLWITDSHAIIAVCRNEGRFLSEIRICLDKEGNYSIPCPGPIIKTMNKSCRQADFLMVSVN